MIVGYTAPLLARPRRRGAFGDVSSIVADVEGVLNLPQAYNDQISALKLKLGVGIAGVAIAGLACVVMALRGRR